MLFITTAASWKRWLSLLTTLLLASLSFAAGTSCPAGCVCSEDGLSATCSDLGEEVPRDLAGSFASLDLSDHGLTAVDGNTFANLPLLEQLDMSRGRIAQVSADAFRELRRLRRLVLSDNWLTSIPEDAFPDSLTELRLAGNPLSLPASRPFLRAYGLSILDLSRCSVSIVGADAFSQLTSLVELDLRGNHLEELSPLAFTGLQRLYVDEGSLGDSAGAVYHLVDYVVEASRTVATTNPEIKSDQVGSQAATVYTSNQDSTAYRDGARDFEPDSHFGWQHRGQRYNDFSPLFGPGSRDVADSTLFKGAPFQATGEVTVVYASDLQNLKDTLLVLAGLAVLCFLLAALQRAVENLRSQRAGRRPWGRCFGRGHRGDPLQAAPHSDNFWWDTGAYTEHLWLEADKPGPRSSELPPPYPHPPPYEDTLGVSLSVPQSASERTNGDVQPEVHGRAAHCSLNPTPSQTANPHVTAQ